MIGSAAKLGAVAVLAAGLLAGNAQANPFPFCKHVVYGTGSQYTLEGAKFLAVENWRAHAPLGYQNWSRAEQRSFHCLKKGNLFGCRARGRPCP